MALSPRKTDAEMLHALVAAHNSTRVGLVASFFHADVTSGATTGLDGFTPSASALTVVGAATGSLAAVITKANDLLVKGNIHMADAIANKIADVTNGPFTLSAVVLVPLASTATQTQVNTQLNALKASYNAHLSQAGVHYTNDTNTVATADASSLGTSEALVDALQAAFNIHIASAPGGASIALIPA